MSKKYELTPTSDLGIFALAKEKNCKVNSVKVAEVLGIEHSKLIRTIEEKILSKDSGWSEQFNNANFGVISYEDSMRRKQKSYDLTRDGLIAVFMSYNTQKTNQLKEAYINQFNTQEELLIAVMQSRLSFPQMTLAIKNNFSEEEIREKWIYKRECDLIYMVVFGHNAKWLKEHLNIEKDQNILSTIKEKDKVEDCVYLQNCNATLMDLGMLDYNERKDKLIDLLLKRQGNKIRQHIEIQ